MPLYRLKSGKHYVRKDGEEIKYVAGDIIEMSKTAVEYFPNKFEEVSNKSEPVKATEKKGTPVTSTAGTAGSAPKADTSPKDSNPASTPAA